MMRFKSIKLLLLVILLTSCNPKVVNYLNQRAKFASFESYSIVNIKISKRKLAPETTRLLGTIESRIKYHMEDKRNYQPSKFNPDLILRYELVSNTSTQTSTNRGFYNVPTFSTQIIYESVVLLEIYHNEKLVWQGSYDLNQNRRDEKNERAINKAIDLIFTTYPYQALRSEPEPSLTSSKKTK